MRVLSVAEVATRKYDTSPDLEPSRIINVCIANFSSIWGFLLLFTAHLCFVPYLMDNTKDVIHSCPNCDHILARWFRCGGNTQVMVNEPAGNGGNDSRVHGGTDSGTPLEQFGKDVAIDVMAKILVDSLDPTNQS